MAKIDLDAKRLARAEVDKTPHELVLGGETFEVPAHMPLEVIDLMAEGKMRPAFEVLLGDPETVSRFFHHRPDDLDLETMMGVYNPDGGGPESSASAASLPNIGRRSRPTSAATTASASRKPATANNSSAPARS